MSDGWLLPDVGSGVGGPFWDGCAAGELRVQTCDGCGRRRFPPRPMCPWCRSQDASWPAVEPAATVWSFAVAHPPLLPAYVGYAPYLVAVVTLDADPAIRLVGPVVADDEAPMGSVPPGDVAIGDPVRATFRRVAGDVVLPWWVLSSGG